MDFVERGKTPVHFFESTKKNRLEAASTDRNNRDSTPHLRSYYKKAVLFFIFLYKLHIFRLSLGII